MPDVRIGVANYERVQQLNKGSIKRVLTETKGGAPFGKAGSGTKFSTMATEPPSNDQKLAG